MNLIFLGAPGVGKGTQSRFVSERLKIPAVSTGDIIRNIIKSGGIGAENLLNYINKGSLLPDEIVIKMVEDRVNLQDCKKGFLLDGFPRTIVQAKKLEEMKLNIDKVIEIKSDENIIYNRMMGRCICSGCGAVFNNLSEMRPKIDGICDICRSDLIRRTDDTKEIMSERLKAYDEQVTPLREHYMSVGKLFSVNGDGPFNETFKNILKILEI
ncbi:MAG: nucleoside monophosphate kinase [Firmicutes bacterium]|nr:nucleoside monophosphate kinase [Bacillota bacterium]